MSSNLSSRTKIVKCKDCNSTEYLTYMYWGSSGLTWIQCKRCNKMGGISTSRRGARRGWYVANVIVSTRPWKDGEPL